MTLLSSTFLAYLANSLWQVPLIYLAAKLLARPAARCGPAMRHRLWVAALILQTIVPATSLSFLFSLRALLRFTHHASSSSPRVTAFSGPGSLHSTLALPIPLLLCLSIVYVATICFFAARFAWSLHRVRRLRRSARPLVLSPAAQACWSVYRSRFRVPAVELAASSILPGPVTIGSLRPLMLLPHDFETILGEEDQSVALAHEFAHIARADFAKNLLYQALSLPIAYHPALRLTLAHIAQTRELLCDALAARAVSGPHRYAQSLLRLASALAPVPSTLPAIGIFDANLDTTTLETRVMNLTTSTRSLSRASRIAVTTLSIATLLGACTSAIALRMEVGLPVASDGPAAAKSQKVSPAVMEGNILKKVPPVYPPDAKEAHITGSVVLKAIIDKNGIVQQLTVVSGPQELRASSLDAVRQWVYKPYLLNGNPTEVETTITINYSLAN